MSIFKFFKKILFLLPQQAFTDTLYSLKRFAPLTLGGVFLYIIGFAIHFYINSSDMKMQMNIFLLYVLYPLCIILIGNFIFHLIRADLKIELKHVKKYSELFIFENQLTEEDIILMSDCYYDKNNCRFEYKNWKTCFFDGYLPKKGTDIMKGYDRNKNLNFTKYENVYIKFLPRKAKYAKICFWNVIRIEHSDHYREFKYKCPHKIFIKEDENDREVLDDEIDKKTYLVKLEDVDAPDMMGRFIAKRFLFKIVKTEETEKEERSIIEKFQNPFQNPFQNNIAKSTENSNSDLPIDIKIEIDYFTL